MPSATADSRIVTTAIGRRFQLFSPSPAKNGSSIRKPRITTGPIRQRRRLHLRRQECQQGVEPLEEEIRLGNGLHDRRIGLSAGTVGTEHRSAQASTLTMMNAAKIMSFHTAYRHEGHAVLLRHLFVLLNVGRAAHQAARHRPLVDAQLQHHQQVYGDESDAAVRE